jgi:hypothetical protein
MFYSSLNTLGSILHKSVFTSTGSIDTLLTIALFHDTVCSEKILSMWSLPSITLAGWNVEEIHGVNLLETLTTTLNEEKVDDDGGDKIASSENVAVGKSNSIGDERSEESKVKVPELKFSG